MITLILISGLLDSTSMGVPRPVDIYVDDSNRIFVLSINGKIWLYEDLNDTPKIFLRGLSQPAMEMELWGDTIFVMHGRYLDAIYGSERKRIVGFIPLLNGNNTFALDTMNRYIYLALEGFWHYKYPGKVFRLSIDGKNMYTYATGLKNPIAMKVDSAGIPWIISQVRDSTFGLHPLYEGLNYSNLEPEIYFSTTPTDLEISGENFIISFVDGALVLYKEIQDDVYEREELLNTPYEISSIFLKGDTIYFTDYVSGRVYRSLLKFLEANK